ncbi:helix-turn-helix transcriptional regulator [Streptomyces sp. NPDC020719]|uniref:helix-turn-helix transcriptional regulator n=1 Tax=unclassified Streptomyces TaxID=2593676 RepID=UPI0033DF26EA
MPWFAKDDPGCADLVAGAVARQAAASLAGLLEERGLTRSQLASRMGVSPGRVSQILSGDANLTIRSLALAAAALDAGVEVLFTGPSVPQAAAETSLAGERERVLAPTHH